uniref:C2H2-type domain-containing protein n=1 Tax=Lotharella globosa TaxID=91324 RepID=A0A7S3Z787_9EUKA|mmetsp:Transcript_2516/g.4927  ORF Transcript_2516/g.4927 Transcript_2516/m.4927 type:complete len:213 (+) Transcript_2516:77-715(+)
MDPVSQRVSPTTMPTSFEQEPHYEAEIQQEVKRSNASANAGFLRQTVKNEPFGCPACRERFSTIEDLEMHVMTVDHSLRVMALTEAELLSLKCPECEESFMKRYQLQRHFQLHTGEDNTCRKCNMWFPHGSELKKHMKEHEKKNKASHRLNLDVCDGAVDLCDSRRKDEWSNRGAAFDSPPCPRRLTADVYRTEPRRPLHTTHFNRRYSLPE